MVARQGSILAGSLAAAILVACVADPVKQAEQRPVTVSPFPQADTQPIALARVVSTIARGTKIGTYSYGPGCDVGLEETWRSDHGDLAATGFNSRFVETLTNAGYRVVGDPSRMFDVAAERASARYLIGGQITELKMSLCNHVNFWTAAPYGPRGDSYIKVRWQVYSASERRVVYETTTDGNGHTQHGTRDGLVVLMQEAFSHAASNLSADEQFRAVIAGRGPALDTATTQAAAASSLEIPRFTTFRTPAAPRLGDLSQSVVTIVLAGGHGSGFFVSSDGLILTNRHVVGEAETVNVRLSGGVELTGRVLRRHALRDVALVKVDLARTRPLPVRQEPVQVGEEVYALGSPLDVRLAGSVTRGIVSAIRSETRAGTEMSSIQSDAAIQAGNSGGPLLDASGNVVGIAVSGYGPGNFSSGLNFFVPISEGLEYLNIRLGQPRELRF